MADRPGWGSHQARARRTRDGVVASKQRVWAMMCSRGLTLPPVQEREPTARRGQVVAASNGRGATDPTSAWTPQDGWAALVSAAIGVGSGNG